MSDGLLRPALLLAASGRVDALFSEQNVVAWQLQQMGKPQLLVLDKALPRQEDGYKLSTLKHPQLLAALDAWLESHGAEVQALRRTYHKRTVDGLLYRLAYVCRADLL
jgi:hypothetical protein